MSKISDFKNETEAMPFSYRQAVDFGVTRRELQAWLDSGEVERLQRGLYSWLNVDRGGEIEFIEATKLAGTPSAIGLISALSYYNLTDIIPTQTWVIVPAAKRSARSGLRVFRQRHPNWEVGIIKNKGFWITSVERTLIESLGYKEVVGKQEAIHALRKAIEGKVTTLDRVFKMSKKLGMERRVRPYLEALA